MSAHRTHRSDGNADEIINALQGCGASVFRINPSGGRRNGLPDVVIGIDGTTLLAEIKQPGGKLTDEQIDWHAAWRGAPVHVLRSVEDVGALVGAVRTGS